MNTDSKTETKESDDINVEIPFYRTFQEAKSPISEINIHYQKNGLKEPLKSCFVDFDTKFKDGTIWWRTMFRCPFTNKVFHSSLPISILKESYDFSDLNSPKLKPTQLTDAFFGNFRLEGDFVYFKTVKNARKSVAIRVLENFSVSGGQSMFQSIAEYHQKTGRTKITTDHIEQMESKEEYLVQNINNGDKVPLETTSDESSLTDLSQNIFPEWVNQLFDIGVDSTSFAIEFKERLPADSDIQQKKPLCRSSPTLLCCKLSVYRPLALTSESKPCQSKTESINDATSLIVEEIRKKMIQSDFSRHCEEFKIKHKKSVCNEKAKMLDMLPKVSTYIFNPPLCMTYPISFSDKNIVAKPKLTLFVYEIVVTTKQGDTFFSKLGLHPSTLTRIGVVLGKDIFDYNKGTDFHSVGSSLPGEPSMPIQAKFNLPQCDIDCGNITLTNRSIVHFNEKEKGKLLILQSFNIILNNWQSHGMSKYSVEYDTIVKSKEISLQGCDSNKRKCLFVPLKENYQRGTPLNGKNREDKMCTDPFDWDLISDIMKCRNKSYIRPFDEVNQYANIFGIHKSINLAQYCALSAFAVVAPKLYGLLKLKYLLPWTLLELMVFYITLFFFVLFLAIHFSPPIIETDYLKLENRFFLQRKAAPKIYTTTLNPSTIQTPTASSSFPVSTKQWVNKDIKKKFEAPKTYSDYYYTRYGVHIRYPKQKLIQVRPIKNTKDAFHSKLCDSEKNTVMPNYIYAIPELITVLPMPRDLMYFIHNLSNFMHPLERTISLHSLERRIFELSSHPVVEFPSRDGLERGFHKNGDIAPYNRKKLLSLLEECTTLSPCIFYQRLEHLGDTVIGFFTSMNLIGRNYELNWDSDDLGNMKNDSVKNKAFFRTALEIGLSPILGVSTCTSKWDVIYKHIDLFQSEREEESSERERNFSNENCVELSDKVLSDVFESILGAVYRLGESSLIVALLEEFKLPLCGVDQEADKYWFQSFGTCIEKGYPFELDAQWTSQMKQINEVLRENLDVATLLELGCKQLFEILSTNCNIKTSQEFPSGAECTNSVIFCALFDDSLSSDYQDSESDESISDGCKLESLQRVALFRDNLFILGDSALHLCICTELFKRYPIASPGDLHLLRACVMCDDVLTYIAVKTGITTCLFDAEATEISLLKMEVEKSDDIGKEYLTLNNGWFIHGGINEYKRRWNDANWSSISTTNTNIIQPNYPGIIGGRLLGHKKKLPSGLTSDLSFSFKAIVGGFVMSYGLERMWQYFLPLFKEVMMFSPEELRSELSDLSPLFTTYQQGRSCHRLESYLLNQPKSSDKGGQQK